MLDDLYESIMPMFAKTDDEQCAFFVLLENLLMHLFHSVLAPEDVASSFSLNRRFIKMSKSPKVVLTPDPEWIERLDTLCSDEHDLGSHRDDKVAK